MDVNEWMSYERSDEGTYKQIQAGRSQLIYSFPYIRRRKSQ